MNPYNMVDYYELNGVTLIIHYKDGHTESRPAFT